jgi:hypothetical protein
LRRSNPAFLNVAAMGCFTQSSAQSRARLARNDEKDMRRPPRSGSTL